MDSIFPISKETTMDTAPCSLTSAVDRPGAVFALHLALTASLLASMGEAAAPAGDPAGPPRRRTADDPAVARALEAAGRIAAQDREWDAAVEALIKAVETQGPPEGGPGDGPPSTAAARTLAERLLRGGRELVRLSDELKARERSYALPLATARDSFGQAERAFRRFAAEEPYEALKGRYLATARMWAERREQVAARLEGGRGIVRPEDIDYLGHINTYLERSIPTLGYDGASRAGASPADFVGRLREFGRYHRELVRTMKRGLHRAREHAFDEGLREKRAQLVRAADEEWERLRAELVRDAVTASKTARERDGSLADGRRDAAGDRDDLRPDFPVGRTVRVYRVSDLGPLGAAVVTSNSDESIELRASGPIFLSPGPNVVFPARLEADIEAWRARYAAVAGTPRSD